MVVPRARSLDFPTLSPFGPDTPGFFPRLHRDWAPPPVVPPSWGPFMFFFKEPAVFAPLLALGLVSLLGSRRSFPPALQARVVLV